MFPENKYTKWYYNIIDKASQENRVKHNGIYYENHHILPKCLGGKYNKKNLVLLDAKEHYICHLCLVFGTKKLQNKRIHKQMISALASFIMTYYHDRYVIPSHMIINIRKWLSESRKGHCLRKSIYSQKEKEIFKSNHWSKHGYLHPLLGKNHKLESIERMSINSSKYDWTVIDSQGNKTYTKQIRKFCKDHNLSIYSVDIWANRGIVPAPKRTKQSGEKRHNITNWSFFRSS